MIACDHAERDQHGKWKDGCGLFSRLPRCYCRDDSKVDFCGAKRDIVHEKWVCKNGRCKFDQSVHKTELEDPGTDTEADLNTYESESEASEEDNVKTVAAFHELRRTIVRNR